MLSLKTLLIQKIICLLWLRAIFSEIPWQDRLELDFVDISPENIVKKTKLSIKDVIKWLYLSHKLYHTLYISRLHLMDVVLFSKPHTNTHELLTDVVRSMAGTANVNWIYEHTFELKCTHAPGILNQMSGDCLCVYLFMCGAIAVVAGNQPKPSKCAFSVHSHPQSFE